MHDIQWSELDLAKFYGYSAVGLVSSRLLLYPPMLLKTRMQTQRASEGMMQTARKVLLQEGVRGLYRGAIPMALGVMPTQAVYLTALETVRVHTRTALHQVLGDHEQVERMVAASVAGGVASCFSAVLGVPLDVITQRMQMGGGVTARFGPVVRSVYRAEGFRGYYRGYWASLVVYAPTSSVWWTTYSNTCVLLGKDDRESYWDTIWRSMVAGGDLKYNFEQFLRRGKHFNLRFFL